MAEMLFDSDMFQVLADIRGTDIVLITFNEMDFKHNGKNFWAEAVALKLGLSAIGFVSKSKNWFPSKDMRLAAEIVAPFISRFRTVILYGHSQGGYAAAKYSRLLGATHVLAFSPQWSIDPAEVLHFDKRFVEHYSAETNGAMSIGKDDVAGIARLFADPHWKEDYIHAGRIAEAYGQPVIVDCNFMFHSTVRERILVRGRFRDQECRRSAGDKRTRLRYFRSSLSRLHAEKLDDPEVRPSDRQDSHEATDARLGSRADKSDQEFR